MKNLQTGTTCLSSSTGSKQHKCRRSLQRLATFVILFLCSMTVAWAQNLSNLRKWQKDLVHKSDEESITATFSSTGLSYQNNYVKFDKNETGTLTIKANAATISNVSLLVSNSTTKPTTGINVKPGDTKVSITTDREMPVEWSTDNRQVVFKCATKDLYVFGATITYKYDDADKLILNEVSDPTITLNNTATTTTQLSFTINQTAKTQTGTSLEHITPPMALTLTTRMEAE